MRSGWRRAEVQFEMIRVCGALFSRPGRETEEETEVLGEAGDRVHLRLAIHGNGENDDGNVHKSEQTRGRQQRSKVEARTT